MESIFNFIFDNLWLIILGVIFLSGFKKSKKKKGAPVNQEIPKEEDYDFREENETEETSPIDDLPLPESIKRILKEAEEDEKPYKSKKTQKPQPEVIEEPKINTEVPQGHFDNPWSGEGKVNPHWEVQPTNTIEPAYGGNGKVFAKEVVTPQDKPSYVRETPHVQDKTSSKLQKSALPKDRDAYAERVADPTIHMNQKKLAEAIVMAEVLGKPKALRRRG